MVGLGSQLVTVHPYSGRRACDRKWGQTLKSQDLPSCHDGTRFHLLKSTISPNSANIYGPNTQTFKTYWGHFTLKPHHSRYMLYKCVQTCVCVMVISHRITESSSHNNNMEISKWNKLYGERKVIK